MFARKFLLVAALAATLATAGCKTYVPAPSTSKISERASAVHTHVAVAEANSSAAAVRALAASVKVQSARAGVKSTGESVGSAMLSLGEKDYTTAAQYLAAAKASNATVAVYLEQTLEDLTATRASLTSVAVELGSAKTEIAGLKFETAALQTEVNKQATTGAGDAAIAKRCKRWFGLGAIFYGVEHMLTAGILGILILGAVVLALVIAGYFVGGPFGSIVMKLAGKATHFVFNRKKE